MRDDEIRAAVSKHWAASEAGDFDTEHSIYDADAVLEYPQSGERIRGRSRIQMSRAAQPNQKRFKISKISGSGDLWVTEYILRYDSKPSYTVSIMEFRGGAVVRETQYFADPFEPGPSRAQFVERMGAAPLQPPAPQAPQFLRYHGQTLAASIVAGTAAAICASASWPVWAMFLGWVSAFAAKGRWQEVVRSYVCFVLGICIGAVGTVGVTDLNPFIGPLSSGVVVFAMATIIASMRGAPYANIVPNFILGVLGIFAFHSGLFDIAGVKVALAGAVGAAGVGIATRLQTRISGITRR